MVNVEQMEAEMAAELVRQGLKPKQVSIELLSAEKYAVLIAGICSAVAMKHFADYKGASRG